MRTAGFVLVGGRSSRMGQDKALLRWRDQTLVEDIAAKVREAAGNVVLVGRTELDGFTAMECLPDLRPGSGPLSGIAAALASGRGDLNLIVACDLPLLQTEWLKMLLKTAELNDQKCVVAADTSGRIHPLCGVYRSDCLPAVQDALDNGRLKVTQTVEELGAKHIELPAPIWNVNTPEEWQRCLDLANGR